MVHLKIVQECVILFRNELTEVKKEEEFVKVDIKVITRNWVFMRAYHSHCLSVHV